MKALFLSHNVNEVPLGLMAGDVNLQVVKVVPSGSLHWEGSVLPLPYASFEDRH